jgi:hypothetical protein
MLGCEAAGCNGDQAAELRGRGRTSAHGLRSKNKTEGREKKRFLFKNRFKQNSNSGLNSTTKNRFSSMYATVISYISLI